MERSAGTTARRTALAIVAACLVAAGCGEATEDASAPTSGSDASTARSSTTSSTTTTTTPELPPCDPAAELRQVAPDWLPEELPEGFEVVYGETQVYPRAPQPPMPETWSFALGERLDGGRLGLKLRLGAGSDPSMSYYQLAPDEPTIDAVRGLPGKVGRVVSRGDGIGMRMARWEEQGLQWTASTAPDALTNSELVELLERLELSRDGVTDPTGALTLLGRTRPAPAAGEDRYTRVVFRRVGAPMNERIQIDVTPPREGSEGIVGPVGDRLLESDRGMVVSNGRAATAAQTGGPSLSLEVIDMSGHGQVTALSMEDVEALLLTPWTRVTDDDPRRRSVPLGDHEYSAEPLEFCRE